MSQFSPWWDALSITLKIYWGIAIPFTLFFILQLLQSFLGGHDAPDDTPDSEVNADHGIAFQFLTLKNLVAFLAIFGWVGIASIDAGYSELVSLIIASISGLTVMLIMASMFYFIGKAGANGTLNFNKAIGGSGEVYLTIGHNRNNIGQVQIKVQGSLRTLEAVTDDEDDIPTGKLITVKSIVNNSILVVTAK